MTTWHSGCPNNAACVEVAADEFGHILVRNSADPADYLAFTRAEFAAFIDAVKAGAFDQLTCTGTEGASST